MNADRPVLFALLVPLVVLSLLVATPEASLPSQPISLLTKKQNYQLVPHIGRYNVHGGRATWKDAWANCTREDGHLLILDSREEADAVRRLLLEARLLTYSDKYDTENSVAVSVGVHALFSDRYWATIFGEPLDDVYHLWAPNRPTGPAFRPMECGAVNLVMQLVDIPCEDNLYSFVCEKPL